MRSSVPLWSRKRSGVGPVSGLLKLPALIGALLLLSLVLYGCGESVQNTQESSENTGETSGATSNSGDEYGGVTRDSTSQSEGTNEATDREESDGGEDKPEAVKGLYVPGSAASGQKLDGILQTVDETEVNALVVDVKEAGHTTYPSEVPLAREIGATTEQIPDLEKLVQKLEDRDVYTIARLSAFQDDVLPRERPGLAVLDSATGGPWRTYQGGTWANPYRERTWEYNAAIAREAAEAGFDEIQLDYVRFPSDGPMNRLEYGEETAPTQEAAIAGFLEYTQKELEPTGAELSADVFGLVGINDFVGIGQVISEMAPHLDVLSPMVYPSHYPAGSYGYGNPDAFPYEIVELAMDDFSTKARRANPEIEIRPWLQDFDYVSAYGPTQVQAQMNAARDSGVKGWLLWNAAGEYTETVLEAEER